MSVASLAVLFSEFNGAPNGGRVVGDGSCWGRGVGGGGGGGGGGRGEKNNTFVN